MAGSTGLPMTNLPRLTHSDRGWLVLAALAVTAAALVGHDPAGLSEALLSQSLAEASESGDWLIPTIGGVAWSDASPLVQWIARPILALTGGDPVLALRVTALLGLVFAGVFTAELAALCGGRRLGLLAGGILLTTFGLTGDVVSGGHLVWLTASTTAVLRLLVAIESESRHSFSRSDATIQHHGPLTTRGWLIVGLFMLLAAVVLGTEPLSMIAVLFVPLTGWLALRGLSAARKYLWVWGLLGILSTAALWLVAVNSQSSGVTYLWQRLDLSSLADWSFQTQVIDALTCTLPWGLLIPVGFWMARHEAFGDADSRERLICSYAVLCPLGVLFLRPQHTAECVAAAGSWSVLAAMGLDAFISQVTLRLNLADARPLRTGLRRAAVGTALMMAAVQVQSNASVKSTADVHEITALVRRHLSSSDVVSLTESIERPDGHIQISRQSGPADRTVLTFPLRPDTVRIAADPVQRN